MASFLLPLIAAFVHANEPFNPSSGDHDHFISHKFYDLYFFNVNETLLDEIKLSNNQNAIKQTVLSNTDDEEIRIDLDWDYLFYGHKNKWINISPNGFLSTHAITCWSFCNWWNDENDENWYRRYIGPLMVDFNPHNDQSSEILYFIDNDEQSLSVQWHNVGLWQPSSADPSPFRWDFQMKLKSDGTIFFYYFQIPKDPKTIRIPNYTDWWTGDNYNYNYSTIVGLEDAAYQHQENGNYELLPYSPINVNFSHVLDRQIIAFRPKQTCIDQSNCSQCAAFSESDLACGWCPKAKLCSDGMGREIFEYESSDYCTDNEQINGLQPGKCVEYENNTRVCAQNDHVLAAYNPLDGASEYFSGVIIEVNGYSNALLIKFDDSALSAKYVSTKYVHKCSGVSFDYSSFDLPTHCIAHCEAISGEKTNGDDTQSSALMTSALIVCCVIIIFCTVGTFFLYRDRRRRSMENIAQNMMMNERMSGMENGMDTDVDDAYNINISEENVNNLPNYENVNRVIHPIISPKAEFMAKELDDDVYSYPVDEVVEIGISDIELGKLEYPNNNKSESPSSMSHHPSSPLKKKQNKYDMTPLH